MSTNTNAKLTTVPTLSVQKTVDMLSDAYCAVIRQGLPMKTLPSVMLWGAPGVGKSQAVRQLAKEIERRTGKKSNVVDVRLLLMNPVDLRGIPTANADKTLAVWLKPHIFQMNESSAYVNILFLDEISAAPQSVQAAAYQITLDRVVGEHKLPENCIVIAAGNRLTDKSVVYKMPKALANRLCHIQVEADFESWKRWAIASGVNRKVIGFLSFKRNMLLADGGGDDLAYPTPRSWEMVSNILNSVNEDVDAVYSYISGCVGAGAAIELRSWCKIYNQLPNIEKIFKGTEAYVPKGIDVMYALCSAMTDYARKHKDDMDAIRNSIVYARCLPPDFSAVLLKDYMSIERGYKERLMRLPEFMAWLSKSGRLLNDAY